MTESPALRVGRAHGETCFLRGVLHSSMIAMLILAESCVADKVVPLDSNANAPAPAAIDAPATNAVAGMVRGIELPLLRSIDITPRGRQCVRPDCVAMDGMLYVSYLDLSKSMRELGMIMVDSKFNAVRARTIHSGGGNVTDMRLACGIAGELWYPYETNVKMRPWGNRLNLASYDAVADKLTLRVKHERLARGNMLLPPGWLPRPGDELTDDPTPFYHGGKYYVLTRRFESPSLIVRVYSRELKLLDEYDLDFSPVIGNLFMRVNAIVVLDDGPFLISGVNNGPLALPGRDGSIIGFPLTEDLTALRGGGVVLSASQEYEDYVSGAVCRDGKLYIVHVVEVPGKKTDAFRGYLKVYDTRRNFAPMASVLVNQGCGGALKDNHLSLALFAGQLCVVHYTTAARLVLKVYGERSTEVAPGTIWSDHRLLDEDINLAPDVRAPEEKDFMKDFDRNDDGFVVRKEFPGPDDVFSTLDRNGDGKVSAAEAKPRGPVSSR